MIDVRKSAVEHRYRALRQVARSAVMEDYAGLTVPDMRLAEIDPEALAAAETWEGRAVNWNWEQLVLKLRRRPRRIELAIWVDPTLCGLALGKVSDRRVTARIDRIERAPESTELVGLIAEMATVYMETLGTLAGCREAVVASPASGLLEFYRDLGYTKDIVKRGKIVGLKNPCENLQCGQG